MSCDIEDQADTDCNNENFGLAFIDDCGYCVGGSTNLQPNFMKNNCGICFEEDYEMYTSCFDENAINYDEITYDDCQIQNDVSLCIYDMCTDYLDNNDSFECSSSNFSNSYQIGEQLSCEDIEQDFSSCYPLCANTFSLSDFEGKVFWLMYEEDW